MHLRRPVKRSQGAFRKSGGPGLLSGSASQPSQSDVRQTIERDSSKRPRIDLDDIDDNQDDFGGADNGWDISYTNLTLVSK